MDIDQKLERCDELEKAVDWLNGLSNNLIAEDIKQEIEGLILKYETEQQDLENELQEESEEEKKYLNREYERSVI